jgi:hypothetical protein
MFNPCEISSLTQALGGPMSIRNYAAYLKSAAVAATFAATAVGAASAADMMPVKAPAPVPWLLVNDNSVSFTYFPGSTDPGVFGATYNPRYQFDLTHFDVNRWGTTFIDISYQQYGNADPVQSMQGATGIHEADALVRNTLSGNAFLGKGTFSNFLTKDISLAYGGLFVVVDNFLAPSTHQYDIGATFTLNLPGTVNFSAYAQYETHHVTQDAFCANSLAGAYGPPFVGLPPGGGCQFTGDQTFKTVPHLELQIIEPLTFVAWPVTWSSFTAVNFPKGTGLSQANISALQASAGWCNAPTNVGGNPCSAETKTEVFSENRLTLDIGKLYWSNPGVWETYVGYRYWQNKFGTDHNAGLFANLTPNTSIESTAFIGTTYHWK